MATARGAVEDIGGHDRAVFARMSAYNFHVDAAAPLRNSSTAEEGHQSFLA